MTWTCWSCDKENEGEVGDCAFCGAGHSICVSCGEHDHDDEIWCTWCEQPLYGYIIGPICEAQSRGERCGHNTCRQIYYINRWNERKIRKEV